MVKTKTIAEVGLNFAFGDDRSKFLDNIKKLINAAHIAGFDYVKFQKRNPDVCVPEDQKNQPKLVPWRTDETTYIQYKKDIELSYDDYVEIYLYARRKGIGIFASVWDKDSVDFMKQFYTVDDINGKDSKIIMKIPSALITDHGLLKYARQNCDVLLISTGMSTEREIIEAVDVGDPDVIFHTNSAYPSPVNELNLNYIKRLKVRYPHREIGYSGHEFGLTATHAAVALGATWIERHVTLDRTNWGSDQTSSVEPVGQIKLIKGIRELELALGSGGERTVFESEEAKRKTLRK